MPKYKTRNTLYWITWKVNTVCYNIYTVYTILQNKKLYEKIQQNLQPKN